MNLRIWSLIAFPTDLTRQIWVSATLGYLEYWIKNRRGPTIDENTTAFHRVSDELTLEDLQSVFVN
jgi:hypothetical protein